MHAPVEYRPRSAQIFAIFMLATLEHGYSTLHLSGSYFRAKRFGDFAERTTLMQRISREGITSSKNCLHSGNIKIDCSRHRAAGNDQTWLPTWPHGEGGIRARAESEQNTH